MTKTIAKTLDRYDFFTGIWIFDLFFLYLIKRKEKKNMKKIVAIIAFALMSVVAFGQVDIYFADIDMGFHIEKERSIRYHCARDFWTDEYIDPVAKAIFDTIVVHYKSFSFYRDYKYGVPQDEFLYDYEDRENEFLTELLGELDRIASRYENCRFEKTGYKKKSEEYRKVWRFFCEKRAPYQEKIDRIEKEKERKIAEERKAREREKVEREFKSISFSLNK